MRPTLGGFKTTLGFVSTVRPFVLLSRCNRRHTDQNMYGRLFPPALRALLSGEAPVVPCSATAVAAHTAAPRATYTTETGAWTCDTARGA